MLTKGENSNHPSKYEHLFGISLKAMFSALLLLAIAACSENTTNNTALDQVSGRWYNASQVTLGKQVYDKHCLSCHLENAKGTIDWRKRLPDGSFPPPPLNGTAHTWHHSSEVLLTVINEGGLPMGGVMPAFRSLISDDHKLAVLAYVQNFWSDEIFQHWQTIDRGE